MKRLNAILICSSMLFLAAANHAQENQVKIGFGVGFGQGFGFLGGQDLSVLSLPIDLTDFSVTIRGEKFRFEPTFGYFRTSSSSNDTEIKSSNLRLGTILAFAKTNGSMNFYYGIDLGVILSSESRELNFPGAQNFDESKTDFFIGPAWGGEYMFSENFSLGGEIQINYISLGSFDENSNSSSSAISSRGKISLRWYFQ